ncbi:MAG: YidC/Oxa1 family membrane protein insertase, partial [Streptococcus mitis]|nr:YidC/Oxa1 family membrane protein insertase [Streptococcus mitis]
NLGGVDTTLVLPILAAVFTFLSTWLSNKALSERNGATTAMMYGIPVLIFIFAVYAPGGVALYWTVSNAYQVLQTYFLNNPFKIIAEREAVVQAQKDLENRKRKAKKKAQKTK